MLLQRFFPQAIPAKRETVQVFGHRFAGQAVHVQAGQVLTEHESLTAKADKAQEWPVLLPADGE